MKHVLGVGILCAAAAFAVAQTGLAQTAPTPIKVLGCLQGDGSDGKPWVLSGVALPAPPAAAAPGGGGGRGGGGRGAAPAAGAGAGAGPARGAGGGAGPAPAAGAGGGGRGAGGGGRGGGAAAPLPPPPPPVPLVDIKLAGVDMTPWRGMKVEVEGMLGARPASGLQEFQVTLAHSVQGFCTPK